jgi:hypothetical protein
MFYNAFHLPLARLHHFQTATQHSTIKTILCIAFIASLLSACGSTSTTAGLSPTPTPTSAALATPTPHPSPTPTPKPEQVPTPTPTPKPALAQAPIPTATPIPAQGAPAILDLRPASMSIVGHLDCQKNGAYICFARVLSRASNQSNLNWSASTNVPGRISFSPPSGVLAPGQSVLIIITVPFTACTPGLFIFQGPINTHTITWAC